MALISLIIAIALIGLCLWGINVYIPMSATIKKILNVAVVVCVVLWILSATGVLGDVTHIQVPHI